MDKNERTWVVVGSAWSLLHLIFLSMGRGKLSHKKFVPFQSAEYGWSDGTFYTSSDTLYYYDYSEFLLYVGVFWLVFLGKRYINKAK